MHTALITTFQCFQSHNIYLVFRHLLKYTYIVAKQHMYSRPVKHTLMPERGYNTPFITSDTHSVDNTHAHAGFPVAQMVEHGASNAKIMGLIPRESKS